MLIAVTAAVILNISILFEILNYDDCLPVANK